MMLEHVTLSLFFASMAGVILGGRFGFLVLFIGIAITITMH